MFCRRKNYVCGRRQCSSVVWRGCQWQQVDSRLSDSSGRDQTGTSRRTWPSWSGQRCRTGSLAVCTAGEEAPVRCGHIDKLLISNLPAAFWTDCRRRISSPEMSLYSALQESRRLAMKALIIVLAACSDNLAQSVVGFRAGSSRYGRRRRVTCCGNDRCSPRLDRGMTDWLVSSHFARTSTSECQAWQAAAENRAILPVSMSAKYTACGEGA